MSKPERLRRFLLERGFGIEKETVLAEGERLYCVMSIAFTGEVKTPSLADCIIGRIPYTPEGIAYLQKQGGRIAERLSGLPNTPEHAAERVELQEAADRLAEWLKND
jgi:tRNA A22 N-methylase